MVDLTEISAVVAAAGVLVGVVYYILEMRHQTKVRQTDTAYRLYGGASTKEAVEAFHTLMRAEYNDYDEFVKRYGLPFSDHSVQTSLHMIAMSMEGIGLMVKRKLVDISLIEELFPVSLTWNQIKPVVEGMRKQFNNPHFYEWAEYLYNEMKKREQKLQQSTA